MKFKKYPTPESLTHVVSYFWTLQLDAKESRVFRFVPDGYTDWVFHLKTPWSYQFPNSEITRADPFHIFGQIKQYIDLHIQNNELELFGVKFFPSATHQIWNVAMHHVTNSCLSLHDLGLKNIRVLQDKVVHAKTTEQRIALLQEYLLNSKKVSANNLRETMFLVHKNDHQLHPEKIPMSLRRLEQRYKNEIGISPKQFQRIIRINRSINSLVKQEEDSFTKTALKHAYFDQSHFIKDFAYFTGYTPGNFLKAIEPSGEILNLKVN